MNSLHRCSIKAQDASGQVLIGLIKSAFSSHYHWENITLGGPQEKMSFFKMASGPILSIPFHLKLCQYGPCKVSLKKNDAFLTYKPPKVSVFFISDWTSD